MSNHKLKIIWQGKQTVNKRMMSKAVRSCLFQQGSLTKYLRLRCRNGFQVELKSQSWQLPFKDENLSLKLRDREYVFIRESWLMSNNDKLVYARTIIPGKTLQGKARILANLGTRPLGEVLFADKKIYRSNIRYAKIPTGCDLYLRVMDNINKKEELWGRRSLFFIQNRPLLISEVFMPVINQCVQV